MACRRTEHQKASDFTAQNVRRRLDMFHTQLCMFTAQNLTVGFTPLSAHSRGRSPSSGGVVPASVSELARSMRSGRTGMCSFVKRGGNPLVK